MIILFSNVMSLSLFQNLKCPNCPFDQLTCALLNLAQTESTFRNIMTPFKSLLILRRCKRKDSEKQIWHQIVVRDFCKRHGILVSQFVFSTNLRKSIHQNAQKVFCNVNYSGCSNNKRNIPWCSQVCHFLLLQSANSMNNQRSTWTNITSVWPYLISNLFVILLQNYSHVLTLGKNTLVFKVIFHFMCQKVDGSFSFTDNNVSVNRCKVNERHTGWKWLYTRTQLASHYQSYYLPKLTWLVKKNSAKVFLSLLTSMHK